MAGFRDARRYYELGKGPDYRGIYQEWKVKGEILRLPKNLSDLTDFKAGKISACVLRAFADPKFALGNPSHRFYLEIQTELSSSGGQFHSYYPGCDCDLSQLQEISRQDILEGMLQTCDIQQPLL